MDIDMQKYFHSKSGYKIDKPNFTIFNFFYRWVIYLKWLSFNQAAMITCVHGQIFKNTQHSKYMYVK